MRKLTVTAVSYMCYSRLMPFVLCLIIATVALHKVLPSLGTIGLSHDSSIPSYPSQILNLHLGLLQWCIYEANFGSDPWFGSQYGYARFWCATTENRFELRPTITNSYGEAFYLNKPVSHTITLYYKNQQTFEKAWTITVITYISSTAVLIYLHALIKIENKCKKKTTPPKSFPKQARINMQKQIIWYAP